MKIVLALIHHDPPGALCGQIEQGLPVLNKLFDALTVQVSSETSPQIAALYGAAGADVQQRAQAPAADILPIGKARRTVVDRACQIEADFVMYCDGDRALHWAQHEPDELARVVARLPDHDFTVLGRTPRALQTHPRPQRETEEIVNHAFAAASGHAWDITGAARGLSRRAATAIVAGCPEDSVGVDGAWPLFLQQEGGYSLAYLQTEGLAFETAARFPNEIAALGGVAQWIAQLEADPRQWALRLKLAQVEVEAIIPYHQRSS